jgi:alkanesulfonate monooxygenase SsuD/methylene tetrahydromethanopterin reductase-like flavin-dependent oxidoreductase (luciferase family)
VPIYFGALTSPTVELAGEIADGIMPVWWSPERVARSRAWAERGRARSAARQKFQVALGLPTYVGDDMAGSRAQRREPISVYSPTCRFSDGCCARAALPPRRTSPSKAAPRPLSAIVYPTPSA